jgi:hypothetical protein
MVRHRRSDQRLEDGTESAVGPNQDGFYRVVRLLTEHARGRAARGHEVRQLLDEVAWARLLRRSARTPPMRHAETLSAACATCSTTATMRALLLHDVATTEPSAILGTDASPGGAMGIRTPDLLHAIHAQPSAATA